MHPLPSLALGVADQQQPLRYPGRHGLRYGLFVQPEDTAGLRRNGIRVRCYRDDEGEPRNVGYRPQGRRDVARVVLPRGAVNQHEPSLLIRRGDGQRIVVGVSIRRTQDDLLPIDFQGQTRFVRKHRAAGIDRHAILLEEGPRGTAHPDRHAQAVCIHPSCRRHPPIRRGLFDSHPIDCRSKSRAEAAKISKTLPHSHTQTASDRLEKVKSRTLIGGMKLPLIRIGCPSASRLLSMMIGLSLKRKFLIG